MASPRQCVVVCAELTDRDTAGYSERVHKASNSLERSLESELSVAFEFTVHQVGNLVVWLLPLDNMANLRRPSGLVFRALHQVMNWQYDTLINHGVLLRGVITRGPVRMTRTRIDGPGIVRGQELLSLRGPYPRMVIDLALLHAITREPLLRAAHHSAKQELEYIHSMLRQDGDGAWYVDYLNAIETELDYPEEYPQAIRAHQDAIIAAWQARDGADVPRNPQQQQALEWLTAYHDRLVRDRELDSDLLAAPYSPTMFAF